MSTTTTTVAATETPAARKPKTGLRLPQVRVLRVLNKAGGPLTRSKISDKIGNKTNVVVSRAIGYSDPEKRAAFRETRDGKIAGVPLLDSGFVREVEVDVHGDGSVMETGYEITAKGKKAFEKHEAEFGKKLPPLKVRVFSRTASTEGAASV